MPLAFRHVTSDPLRNFDAEVPDGIVVGVSGENGSGKGQLLRLAAGLELPASCKVERPGAEPVVLFGSSWGASCALGAARDLPSLRALVLYEPSLGQRQPPGSLDRMEKRIAAGDHEGALVEMGRAVGLTEEQIAERRAAPNWSQRVATVPTAVRESRIEEDWDWQSENLSGIAVPTLLLTGSETPPGLAEVTSVTAAAIPGARVRVLTGDAHVAHVSEPGVVAQVLRNWLQ